MAHPLFEKEREKFLRFAEEKLGKDLFEQVSGELWLRCDASVRKLLRRPPDWWEPTARNELSKLVKRIQTAENDFFNRGTVTRRSVRTVRLWEQ